MRNIWVALGCTQAASSQVKAGASEWSPVGQAGERGVLAHSGRWDYHQVLALLRTQATREPGRGRSQRLVKGPQEFWPCGFGTGELCPGPGVLSLTLKGTVNSQAGAAPFL